MSESGSGLSGPTGLWLAAGVSVVIVGGAAWFSLNRQTDVSQVALVGTEATPTAAAPASQTAPAPDGEDAVVATETLLDGAPAEDTSDAVEPVTEAAAPILPAFDEVRRESDGMTIIAGRAAPGADLKVLQNGIEVASLTTDSSGKFATFLMIPPNGEGHVLSLEQTLEGQKLASDGQIILAPIAVAEVPQEEVSQEPVEVAEAVAAPASAPAAEEEAPAEDVTDTDVAPKVETAAVAPADTNTAQAADEALAEASQPIVAAPQAPAADPPSQPADLVIAGTEPPTTPAATEPPKPATATASVVLKSTSDGVELLNTQAPEVMKRVALDTISYSDLGDVQLTGRAQAQTQSVRVYLNNAPVASLAVDASGRWRGDLPDIDEGIYTLRVDEVAEDGSVTSRVETPFKREDPAVLVQAAADQQGPLKRITVQKGNTLWAIARERYGEGQLYVRVFQANAADIRDPDLIYPGQVFDLPD